MTERAEHTAGPWIIPDIPWEPWEGAIEVRSKNDDVICYTSSGHGREKFDARLIAAAPDLLAKLVEIRKWMDADVCGPWDAKFISEIDALVAKATGEA